MRWRGYSVEVKVVGLEVSCDERGGKVGLEEEEGEGEGKLI